MVCIEAPASSTDNVLSTEHILSVIARHAESTALLLLPGIQYYTGQLLDMPAVTAFAHRHGIFVIWDLAHAVGNVPLALHDWDVDAAAWCTYKYLNGGPGCIGGLFVHERVGGGTVNEQQDATTAAETAVATASLSSDPAEAEIITSTRTADGFSSSSASSGYPNRLAGWWGNSKATRFVMANEFVPVAGAAGFQISNPSVADLTSVCASLEVFAEAGGVSPLREKSRRLTAYLEDLLLRGMSERATSLFRILTPSDPNARGAQLSLLLADGLLEPVMAELERRGVIVDERRPNVVRVAPAPLYNTFADCFDFVEAFDAALEFADASKKKS
jgi:kynureninase